MEIFNHITVTETKLKKILHRTNDGRPKRPVDTSVTAKKASMKLLSMVAIAP